MSKLFVPIRRSTYLTLGAINKMAFNRREKIFILTYHSIGCDNWAFSVKPEDFKKQIWYLIKNNYKFISLSDIYEFINGRKEITENSVAIMFDDGYKNILQIKGFLQALGIQPAVAILSDVKHANRKEMDNNHEFLNREDVLDLVKAGWEVGCHSATHPDMDSLNEKQIIMEIIDSRKSLLNELKIPIDYLVFPKGKYTKEILETVKKAGYKMALTMNDGKIYQGMNGFLIPRIGVDGTHSFREFKTLFLPSVIRLRKFVKERTGVII